MKVTKQALYIIMTVLFASICMSLVDGVLQPGYLIKSIFKIVLFLGVPIVYGVMHKDEQSIMKNMFQLKSKQLRISLVLGIGVYAVILFAYFVCKQWIDFENIQQLLTSGVGVDANNFIYVAIYISFMNSLLEEFFFRGFAFLVLKKYTNRVFAYVFSAGMFAMYHVGMTTGWFSIGIYVLALLGLGIGGCLFNYLDEISDSIYSSWFVHMFANFAINTVGCILFGIL